MKSVPWWVAAGVLAATTIANTAASEGDRLVNAVLAAVIVGVAVVVVHVRRQMSEQASAIGPALLFKLYSLRPEQSFHLRKSLWMPRGDNHLKIGEASFQIAKSSQQNFLFAPM